MPRKPIRMAVANRSSEPADQRPSPCMLDGKLRYAENKTIDIRPDMTEDSRMTVLRSRLNIRLNYVDLRIASLTPRICLYKQAWRASLFLTITIPKPPPAGA